MQSKKMSSVEVTVGAIIGYLVAMSLYRYLLPYYGHATTWGQSFEITLIFTTVSILRAYIVRRIFNKFSR